MGIIVHIQEAFINLLTAKMRSFLAVLGVLVGTASVVALVSGGQIATENALAQFKELGTDLLSVSINTSSVQDENSANNELTVIEALDLQNTIPTLQLVAPYTTAYAPMSFSGNTIDGSVLGATDTLQEIIKIRLARGRFVSYLDKNEYYCVIGADIAKRIIQAGALNPIGEHIQVGNFIFTIIGVARPWLSNEFIYSDINSAVIVPLETSYFLNKYVAIHNIIFRLKSGSNIPATKTRIMNALNKMVTHKGFFFQSAEELIASMTKQHETFTWLLGFIGGISLFVGGIGVNNIILVFLTERPK